jgi:hypothetical protein
MFIITLLFDNNIYFYYDFFAGDLLMSPIIFNTSDQRIMINYRNVINSAHQVIDCTKSFTQSTHIGTDI